MNTHQEIARITEELRALYLNDNDAPRLIAEMLEREFPNPRKVLNGYLPGRKRSGDWGIHATKQV
jgi:hypothetical protein